MNLFTSQDTSQEEQFRQSFEKQREYIDGYENISCYTAKGLTEDAMWLMFPTTCVFPGWTRLRRL